MLEINKQVIVLLTLFIVSTSLYSQSLNEQKKQFISSFKVKYQEKYKNKLDLLSKDNQNLLLNHFSQKYNLFKNDKEKLHIYVKHLYKFFYSCDVDDAKAEKYLDRLIQKFPILKNTDFEYSLKNLAQESINRLDKNIEESKMRQEESKIRQEEWDNILEKLNNIGKQ